MNQGSIFVTVLARTRVLSRFANGGGEVFPNSKKCLRMRRYWLGRVAQLVRAPASHAGGHRFESCRAHHSNQSFTTNFRDFSRLCTGLRERSSLITSPSALRHALAAARWSA